jgi:RimJ/RimL family protein N-acetyltransferase
MSEVLARVMEYSLTELGLHRLEADVDQNNQGSLGLLEKAGFQREGYFRERWQVYNKWQDSVMLGLLEPEWREARGSN